MNNRFDRIRVALIVVRVPVFAERIYPTLDVCMILSWDHSTITKEEPDNYQAGKLFRKLVVEAELEKYLSDCRVKWAHMQLNVFLRNQSSISILLPPIILMKLKLLNLHFECLGSRSSAVRKGGCPSTNRRHHLAHTADQSSSLFTSHELLLLTISTSHSKGCEAFMLRYFTPHSDLE